METVEEKGRRTVHLKSIREKKSLWSHEMHKCDSGQLLPGMFFNLGYTLMY